jgi:lipopolysaccharide/colanic/teichoic acid biosynthesis glycosyltransferase/capsular polysaccharide biosynthesis protein
MRRTADILVAVLAAVLTAPVMLAVGMLIVVVMGRPVFFRQWRVGRDGARFTVWKFRTMRPEQWPGQPDADRIPRLGELLRQTSLDELPQLWNIVRGDMSLIGPRPTLPEQVAHYSPRQSGRLAVRPGLTGWAQVSGRNTLSWPERIELDLWYIDHRGALLDLKILLRTVVALLRPKGVTGVGGVNPDFPVPVQRDPSPAWSEPMPFGRPAPLSVPPPPPPPPSRRSNTGNLEASMRGYLRVLTRYWGVIVAGLIVGLAIAAAITVTLPPVYTSQAMFLLSVPGSEDPSNAEEKAKSYVKLLTIERAGEGVVRSLGLNESPAEFTERVTARLDTDTMIVRALVTDSSPTGAQRIATALGEQFTALVAEFEQPPGTAPGTVPGALTVRVVQSATMPMARTAPVTSLNLGLGAILGVLAGIGLALARDRTHGDEDVRARATHDEPGHEQNQDRELLAVSAGAETSPTTPATGSNSTTPVTGTGAEQSRES